MEAAEALKKEETEMMAAGDPQIRGQAPQQPSGNQRLVPRKLLLQPVIQLPPQQTATKDTYRGQTADPYVPPSIYSYPGTSAQVSPPSTGATLWGGSVAPTSTPLQTSSTSAYQRTAANTNTILGNPYDTLHAPATVRFDPHAPPGASPYIHPVPGKIILQETRTGSLMASIAVSSDSGLMGRFVFEEQNFDITNYPRGFRVTDWKNAFRGRGQRFRIEAAPGTQTHRYSAMWETPFWLDLDYSFGVNGFYYQRYYDEWYENRTGGGISFGKLWTQDVSTRLSLGGQEVKIYRPMNPFILEEAGTFPMYNIGLSAIYNTRDSEYMPTEGHYASAGIEQILGKYQFIRGSVDVRKYFMLRERPDRSGRWVLGLRSSLGVTEGHTPMFERYYGGGFTNLRGFEFRGVTPRTHGYRTGGCMEFYNSVEMIFPLTADDMIRGSVFIDTGTVESKFSKWEENYRVAMGFGLRLTIPMMGPAPIALDFAFPISSGRFDDKQIFSFGMSMMR
jgi:outer membrane protein insertion porin family